MPEKDVTSYWITPIGGDEINSGESIVLSKVGEKRMHGLGKRTPGRKGMKAGDWICFYIIGKGVAAHARLASPPQFEPTISPLFPYVLHLDSVRLYLEMPRTLDLQTRTKLDAFKSRTQEGWGWFVTSTHRISKHDFRLLTENSSLIPQ